MKIYFNLLAEQNAKLPTEENVETSEKISETTTDLPNGQSDVDKNISESITSLSAEKADEDQKITDATAIPLAENLDAYGNVSEDLQELDRNEQNRQMELWISSNTKRCPKCDTNHVVSLFSIELNLYFDCLSNFN